MRMQATDVHTQTQGLLTDMLYRGYISKEAEQATGAFPWICSPLPYGQVGKHNWKREQPWQFEALACEISIS